MKHLADFISEIVGETVFGEELNIKHESSMSFGVFMDGRTLVRLKFNTNVQKILKIMKVKFEEYVAWNIIL